MNATKQASESPKADVPTFWFFRETPRAMLDHPPLASSLQSFETALFLIALRRFPGALRACAAAVVRRCYCVRCDLVVTEGNRYLADELLAIPIEVETRIRKEFGMW